MSADDWETFRIKPKSVNFNKIFKRNPKHSNCDLIIHNSKKNSEYRGLYCCQHNHWFTWINADQEKYLNSFGIRAKDTPQYLIRRRDPDYYEDNNTGYYD